MTSHPDQIRKHLFQAATMEIVDETGRTHRLNGNQISQEASKALKLFDEFLLELEKEEA